MTPEVNVVLIDFKSTMTKELVTPNEDGSYTILLNSRMASNQLEEAYHHAMEHIVNDDFNKADVQQIETIAHGLADAEPIPQRKFEAELKRLRRERRKLQNQMKQNEKKLAFLLEHANAFDRSERYYLYGSDL